MDIKGNTRGIKWTTPDTSVTLQTRNHSSTDNPDGMGPVDGITVPMLCIGTRMSAFAHDLEHKNLWSGSVFASWCPESLVSYTHKSDWFT